MKKYGVVYTIIYNGYKEIEAESYDKAMELAEDELEGDSRVPSELTFGNVDFDFGEVTADYADELNED